MTNKKITCPTCQVKHSLAIPSHFIVDPGRGLATIAVKATCKHSFHVYIDHSYKIRGYQPADVEFIAELIEVDREITSLISDDSGDGRLKNTMVDAGYLDSLLAAQDDMHRYNMAFYGLVPEAKNAKNEPVVAPSLPNIQSLTAGHKARMEEIKQLIIKIQQGKNDGIPEKDLEAMREALVVLRAGLPSLTES